MELNYKTNINCGGCVAKVTPFLDGESRIKTWKVNTEEPQKILTVETDDMKSAEVMDLVRQAGFEIEEKKKGWLSRFR